MKILHIPEEVCPEYEIAKSILKWIGTLGWLTPLEIEKIIELNKKSFGVAEEDKE
ncbi:MAG: hypothetical protein FWE16_00080 [Firmicutes bacterium]|nr:hypothetical protein [Bacillota bacterium]